jgi:hypothetical protein
VPLHQDNSFLDYLSPKEREILQPKRGERKPLHEVVEQMVPPTKGRPPKRQQEPKAEWE